MTSTRVSPYRGIFYGTKAPPSKSAYYVVKDLKVECTTVEDCQDWMWRVMARIESLHIEHNEMLARFSLALHKETEILGASMVCLDCLKALRETFMKPYEESMAVILQKHWRGYYVQMVKPHVDDWMYRISFFYDLARCHRDYWYIRRMTLKQSKRRHVTAIQACWRGYRTRWILPLFRAAAAVQKACFSSQGQVDRHPPVSQAPRLHAAEPST